MSFFRRHPRFWIAVWAAFGLGGLVMVFRSVSGGGFDVLLLVKAFVAVALALTMIVSLIPDIRNPNA